MVRKNYAYVDWFRLPAALMVIAIHTAPFSSINPMLDTLFTYGLGRIAVPFFFMTTGYFVIAPYVFGNFSDGRKYRRFLKKNLLLYGAAILLYIPVMWYAGKLPRSIGSMIKMLVFDGTFYHLWYFPALLMGSVVLVGALKRFSAEKVLAGTIALYLAGLLGDSYYGLVYQVPVLRMLYGRMFQISSYTRNGIFYAPLFLLMGMLLAKAAKGRSLPENGQSGKGYGRRKCAIGFLAALLIMLLESCMTDHFDLQRHNSMYLALPAVTYFLYKLLLIPGRKAPVFLRSGTAFLYIIHPIGIIMVRGAAGKWKLEKLLVENSLIHYGMVCIVSLCMMMVWLYLDERRERYVRKRQSLD